MLWHGFLSIRISQSCSHPAHVVLDAAISADGPMVDNPSGQGCGRDFRSLLKKTFHKLSEPPGKPEKGTTMEAMGVPKIRGTLYFGSS